MIRRPGWKGKESTSNQNELNRSALEAVLQRCSDQVVRGGTIEKTATGAKISSPSFAKAVPNSKLYARLKRFRPYRVSRSLAAVGFHAISASTLNGQSLSGIATGNEIPEPATAAMLASAGTVALVRRRRPRRA